MIQIEHPHFLLLIPILVVFLPATSRSQNLLARWRRVGALLVRVIIAILLGLALSHPILSHERAVPRATWFLLDLSESTPETERERAVTTMARISAQDATEGHATGLIAFSGRPEIIRTLKAKAISFDSNLGDRIFHTRALRELTQKAEGRGKESLTTEETSRLEKIQHWISQLKVEETDLPRALLLAKASLPEGVASRLIVFTDGHATSRHSLPEETLFVPMEASGKDLILRTLDAPIAVREGEPFDLRVNVETTAALAGRFVVMIDDRPQSDMDHPFRFTAPTKQTISIRNIGQTTPLERGLHEIKIVALVDDGEPRNNFALAGTTVVGRLHALLLEGSEGRGEIVHRMLKAQDMDVNRQPVSWLAMHTSELDRFDALLLIGVQQDQISESTLKAIREFVEFRAGGLLVIGDPKLIGDKSPAQSPLESLLPVRFLQTTEAGTSKQPPQNPFPSPSGPVQTFQAPLVTLLLLIDKSGSMAGRSIALAKESCLAAAKTLTPKDFIGVLAFDAKPVWILDITPASNQEYIEERVMRLYADGGTNIYPALIEAFRTLKNVATPVRHCVLLSDGKTTPAPFDPLIKAIADNGITISTVCVGSGADGFDINLMSQISQIGRGRCLYTNDFKRVPQIFTNEARRIILETKRPSNDSLSPGFIPSEPPPPEPQPSGPQPSEPLHKTLVRVRDAHEAISGIDSRSLPPLDGYLPAKEKPLARVPLEAEDRSPILALWRYGLGKVAVWTSDYGTSWSASWIRWPGAPKVLAQTVRTLAGAAPKIELASRFRLESFANRAELHIQSNEASHERFTVRAGEEKREVSLQRVDSRELVAEVPLPPPGQLLPLSITRTHGDTTDALACAVPQAYPLEYGTAGVNREFFDHLPASSRRTLDELEPWSRQPPPRRHVRDSLVPWCLLAALLLLPLDVGLRRFV